MLFICKQKSTFEYLPTKNIPQRFLQIKNIDIPKKNKNISINQKYDPKLLNRTFISALFYPVPIKIRYLANSYCNAEEIVFF